MRNISDSSLFMPRAYLKWPASSQLGRSCLLALHMGLRMWMSRMWMGMGPFSVRNTLKAMRYRSGPSVADARGALPATCRAFRSRGAASYYSLAGDTSHAGTNLAEGSVTAANRRSLPRTSCRFSPQPHLSPAYGGLRVPVCRSTICRNGGIMLRYPGYGVLVHVRPPGAWAPPVCCPPASPCPAASGPARCTGAARGGARIPGCPGTAARILGACSSARLRALRGTARGGYISPSCSRGASASDPRLQFPCRQRVGTGWATCARPPRYACACTPFRWCGICTRTWGSRPQTRPGAMRPHALGGRVPAVPARGLDLVPLPADMGAAARHAIPRRPASPGFPASRACHDPMDRLRS